MENDILNAPLNQISVRLLAGVESGVQLTTLRKQLRAAGHTVKYRLSIFLVSSPFTPCDTIYCLYRLGSKIILKSTSQVRIANCPPLMSLSSI
jgi:hypothetical protein